MVYLGIDELVHPAGMYLLGDVQGNPLTCPRNQNMALVNIQQCIDPHELIPIPAESLFGATPPPSPTRPESHGSDNTSQGPPTPATGPPPHQKATGLTTKWVFFLPWFFLCSQIIRRVMNGREPYTLYVQRHAHCGDASLLATVPI